MAKDHDIEKKQIKKAAMNYAILYYKNKSRELTNIFTSESIRMLEKYTYLRRHLMERDQQILLAANRNVTQEYIILDLRNFI